MEDSERDWSQARQIMFIMCLVELKATWKHFQTTDWNFQDVLDPEIDMIIILGLRVSSQVRNPNPCWQIEISVVLELFTYYDRKEGKEEIGLV